MQSKRITVFGGSAPRPGEPAYAEAERLGQILGAAGCTVLTGGYIGTMEAVSKGVVRAGGCAVGVTCEEIERWRKVSPNAYLSEEHRCANLAERLDVLVHECDAAIALPGSVGTLTEIFYLWNHMVIDAIPVKPLVLVGMGWQAVIETFYAAQPGYTPESQQALVQFAPDIDRAVQMVLR